MNPEIRIQLNKFKPREYQYPIFDALENKHYKRVLCILPRRAGKDVCGFNAIIRASLRKIGVYYYIFPSYSQGKKVIWDSITNTGERFLDYIPKELIASQNSQEMKITLTNGSLIQIVGSDNVDSLCGTNPQGIVFSEYALQDPKAYQFLRPILLANDGWALFLSTPRGKSSHLWELYQISKNSTDWFAYLLTVEQTRHIPLAEIEKERAEGLMSDDLIQQEYWCSFSRGIEGAIYTKYIDRIRINGNIGIVPWESSFKVHTAWDLGMADKTTIIFFQNIGQIIRIIDFYENSGYGLEHYAKILQGKPYTYGKHIAPHDIQVRELGTGVSRLEASRRLGINFVIAPHLPLEDGIEAVRTTINKLWIDENACSLLIKALENYRYEWDNAKKKYRDVPLHDSSSHACDALRYLCISLPKTADGLSAEELNKRYQRAVYGADAAMPAFFRDDMPRY